MKLYAGIDGGQTSTTAVVADGRGKVLGHGKAGPSDEVAQDAGSTRLRDAFATALQAALRAAQLPAETKFAAVVAGLSGYEGILRGAPPVIAAGKFDLLHDATVAHAASFGAGEGVLVIVGTGSVAYGVNAEGQTCRIGGWGYLFGDKGSAFWIGRRMLERAADDEDAALPSPIKSAVLDYYHAKGLRSITDAFYAGKLDRATIAGFAERTFELATEGIDDARFIVRQAADALAALGALCARRLHGNKRVIGRPVAVSFGGGLMQNAGFAALTGATLLDRLPEAQVVAATQEPAAGALLLAYRADGVDPLPRLH